MTEAPPAPLAPARDRNIARQHRFWTRRAVTWDHDAGSNPGLVKVVEQVIECSGARESDHAVDLGCGSGQVSLGLARKVATVLAIDISEKMIALLLENAAAQRVENVRGKAIPVERLDFAPGSVDLVVTNYALHHLRDEDKPVVVERVYGWLRPGGRFVIGDMMFGRGGDARPRDHRLQALPPCPQGPRGLVAHREERQPLPAALPGAPDRHERLGEDDGECRVQRRDGRTRRERGSGRARDEAVLGRCWSAALRRQKGRSRSVNSTVATPIADAMYQGHGPSTSSSVQLPGGRRRYM